MLIALAGRKGTGKTTLSNELLNRGFKKISFADKLKELLAEIYDWTLDELNNQDKKEQILDVPAPWNQDTASQLASLVGYEGNLCEDKRTFATRREAMQLIGTEVLREKVDQDFHIKEFAKRITNGQNYVNDDLRFPNELKIVNEVRGCPVYLLRPYHFNFSTHSSETALKRIDFRYVMVNKESLEGLVARFNEFVDDTLAKKENALSTVDVKLNHNAFSLRDEEATKWANFLGNHAKLVKENSKFIIEVASPEYDDLKDFKDFTGLGGEITRYRYGNFSVDVDSEYIIDDLKYWNLDFLKNAQ